VRRFSGSARHQSVSEMTAVFVVVSDDARPQ
jgi:hypothetical protein